MSELIVIGYYGGYGGTFLANLLDKTLNKRVESFKSFGDKNEYNYRTSVLGDERYVIEAVFKAYDIGLENLNYKKEFDKIKVGNDFSINVEKMYGACYDPERSVFVNNVKEYLKKRLRLKPGINVLNAHHYKKKEGFDISFRDHCLKC